MQAAPMKKKFTYQSMKNIFVVRQKTLFALSLSTTAFPYLFELLSNVNTFKSFIVR